MKRFTVPLLLALYLALLSGALRWSPSASVAAVNTAIDPSRLTVYERGWVFDSDGYSVRVPEGQKGETYELNDGQTVTVFVDDLGNSFQIFTMPYDGPGGAQGVIEALPPVPINEPTEMFVGGEPAIAFYTPDEALGDDTYEVWFIHDGLLYQVMTYAPLDAWLSEILNTWRFR